MSDHMLQQTWTFWKFGVLYYSIYLQALPRFDEDDNIIKAHIMKVSWTADHRIIEGAQMARFSNLWKSYLENPALLILNMR